MDDNSNLTLLTPGFFAVHALEGLEVVREEWELLKDICKGTKEGDHEEAVAKVVKSLMATRSHSVQSAEWTFIDGVLYFQGKIYVPNTSDLHRHIVSLCHDTRQSRHARRWKTMELVSRNYWWPQMSQYVVRYVSTCDLCLQMKAHWHPPVGELHPLLIPDTPWDTISIDFIVELLDSAGHNAVMVVVDRTFKALATEVTGITQLPWDMQ